MKIERINSLIQNYDWSYIIEYDTKNYKLTIEFEADGGPFEVNHPRLIFVDVQVLHLPRVFHCPIGIRLASSEESRQIIPATSFDPEDHALGAGQCFIIQKNKKDTGFYIYAGSFDILDIPESFT